MVPSGERERNNFIQDLRILNHNTTQKKEIIHATGLLNGRTVNFKIERTGPIDQKGLRKLISDSFVGKTKQYDTFNVTHLINKNVDNLKITVIYSDMSVAEKLQNIKASGKSLNNVFKKADSLSKKVFDHIKKKFDQAEKLTQSAKNSLVEGVDSKKEAVNREARAAVIKAKELRDGFSQLYSDTRVGVKAKYEEIKDKLKPVKPENEFEIEIEEQKEALAENKILKMSQIEEKRARQDFQSDLLRDYFLHNDKYQGKFIDIKEGEFVVVTKKPKNCKEIGQEMLKFLDKRYAELDEQMSPIIKQYGPSSEKLEGLGMQILLNRATEERIINRNNNNPYAPSPQQRK